MDAVAAETDLPLNRTKREIIVEDFSKISMRDTFKDFIRVEREEMTLLGSPVSEGKAQDAAIKQKTVELQKVMKRLALLQSHDALVLLKNSLEMPKLLYLLRTLNCSACPLLADFDRTGLCTILNVDLYENQWLQASLPVADGGLGIRSAQMLASSAFLASAASTLTLPRVHPA